MTKKYKTLKICFLALSILCSFGPLIYFVIDGFIGAKTVEKLALTFTTLGALIVTITAVFLKIKLRCPVFIILIGLAVALDKILPCIITVAICTILDEVVFTPLSKKYKELYTINKEIDKRG